MRFFYSLRYILVAFLGFSTFALIAALPSAPELSSDEPIEYDDKTQEVVARGNARLKIKGADIDADEIRFNKDKNTIGGVGDVTLNQKQLRLVADSLDYNFEHKTFEAHGVRVGHSGVYLEGDRAHGTLEEMTIDKAHLYLAEPAWAVPNFESETMVFRPKDEVVAKKTKVKIGEMPIAYLPSYTHSLKPSRLRLRSSIGQTSKLGWYAANDVYWKQNEHFYWGGLIDGYSKRGVLLGPALKYDVRNAGSVIKGEFKAAFIKDGGKRGTDRWNDPIHERRGFVQIRHQQTFYEKVDLTADINYWTDSEVLADFRPKYYENNQNPDNFVELVYRREQSTISGFGRFAPNNFQQVPERKPELRYDLLPSRFFESPIYQRLNVGYAHLRQEAFRGTPAKGSNRFDVFYGWSLPYAVDDKLTLTPVLGARVDHYTNSYGAGGQRTDLRGQVGFDATMHFYGTWDYQNKFWDIDGIRHIIRPMLQYRYIPKTTSGGGTPGAIDDDIFTTSLPPIDLGYLRNVDDSRASHVMRFGLQNVLQTRHKKYGSRELAALNFYQDLRIKRATGEHKLGSFYKEFSLSPAYWLNFTTFSRYDFTNNTLQELRTTTTIKEGDLWSIAFDTGNLHHITDQFGLTLEYKLNARTRVKAHWRYDTRAAKLVNHKYTLYRRLSNVWDLELFMFDKKNSKTASGFGFGFAIAMVDF